MGLPRCRKVVVRVDAVGHCIRSVQPLLRTTDRHPQPSTIGCRNVENGPSLSAAAQGGDRIVSDRDRFAVESRES